MTVLLPCPFCGTVDDVRMSTIPCWGLDRRNFWYVRCNLCGARGPMEYSKEAAYKGWNERGLKDG